MVTVRLHSQLLQMLPSWFSIYMPCLSLFITLLHTAAVVLAGSRGGYTILTACMKIMFLFYFLPANPLGILIANLLSPALVPEGKHIPLMVNVNCFNQSAGLIWVQLIYLFGGGGAGKTGNLFFCCVAGYLCCPSSNSLCSSNSGDS